MANGVSAGQPQGLSDGADRNQPEPPDTEPEVLSRASEALRPFLRNEAEASHVAMQVVSAVRLYAGPIPPPEMLAGYNAVLPGSAREIMDMAAREQKHRHLTERLEILYPYVGMVAGLIALLSCIAASVYIGARGNTIVASLLLGAPLIGAIGWLINSRIGQKP